MHMRRIAALPVADEIDDGGRKGRKPREASRGRLINGKQGLAGIDRERKAEKGKTGQDMHPGNRKEKNREEKLETVRKLLYLQRSEKQSCIVLKEDETDPCLQPLQK